MADSVDVVESSADRGSIQSEIDDWIAGTTHTSIDFIDQERIGGNRVAITIGYTA